MGKAERDKSARDRIKEQRDAEHKQAQRKRVVTYATVGAVAVLAVGAGWLFAANKTESEATSAAVATAPVTIAPYGSVSMAKAGVTTPVLDIYEDFQCPACKQLEEISGPTFRNLAAEGRAKVVYHPITIFPENFNDGMTRANSVRASAAARCVPDGKQWMAYHDKLFADQPDETVEGFKLDQLVAWGEEAGVTAPDFASCVTTQKHAPAHIAFSDKVLATQKLQGTPTVKLNGKEMDNKVTFSPKELRQAVLDGAK